ncbi:MAG: 1-(5-phosphoribosyl)-5-[(5-phosphoribosylamino)methylideneamino] imidazole-4-carboxamide isomerase [Bacteroidetes bacterium]|nr:1-(5-phosphoribosyl)-5-[(5-phosphoribosylamino)methylideneamino] imidazole-4-carboxamide isomerase [Bacteroidota bacterium]
MPNKVLVIPSIDIKDRKTVRVVKGIPELNCSDYGNDPVEMALIWRAENAKCLHVVDFNAAHDHSHTNFDIVKKICESVIIPVELGGGIKTFEDAKELFDLGVFRLVVGSMAFQSPDKFEKLLNHYGPKLISAAIDVIDDEVVVSGRSVKTGIPVSKYAKQLVEMGTERLIVTDVNLNGMLKGPNIDLCKRVADETGISVTLSGGISGYPDLKKVQDAADKIDSVIIGRALYENKFPCQKIWRVAESGIFN